MKASLSVNAEPTGIVTRAATETGSLTLRSPGVDHESPVAPQWAKAITAFMDTYPELEIEDVGVGACHLMRATAHDLLHLLLDRGVRRVALTLDIVAAYIGALGDRQGAVIEADTVAACLACGPNGVARVDGWGPMFGDAGSAFWIGRSAVEAALRGYDGRRQLTALTDMVRSDFPDLDEAYLDLQASPGFLARVASYAPRVDALAASDRVAANILDKAAAHLSEAVQAAIRRAGLTRPDAPLVVALGTVFDSWRVRSRFCDYLTLQWPSFALTEPAGDKLDGAAALHSLPTQHPLFERISFAER